MKRIIFLGQFTDSLLQIVYVLLLSLSDIVGAFSIFHHPQRFLFFLGVDQGLVVDNLILKSDIKLVKIHVVDREEVIARLVSFVKTSLMVGKF